MTGWVSLVLRLLFISFIKMNFDNKFKWLANLPLLLKLCFPGFESEISLHF